MDIEHLWSLMDFAEDKSHAQDGEKLPVAAVPQPETASGDPAMAFELPRSDGRQSARLELAAD